MLRPYHSLAVTGLTAAVFALLSVGCQSRTATVTGTVCYQGKTVSGGSVVFYCPDKQIVRGLIDSDGRYCIPNVPCGSAIVTVQAPVKHPAGLKMRQKLPPSSGGPLMPLDETTETRMGSIPLRYAHPEESGLTVVVDRGEVMYDIDLKP
ncbi:MAG: carboxypeptidase-like regulatory domain-containing protein [Planctomycetia bacterium]|nr:carboxypeptidase-like regulatory domain-containing protein [Planctomycetia bacterium]